MSVEIVKMSPKEIFESVLYSPDNKMLAFDKAAEAKVGNLSAFLEMLDPSPEGSVTDAFERQLKQAAIVTVNDPAKGIYASRGELFFQSNVPASRILFPEFLSRILRAFPIDETDYLGQMVAGWEIADVPLFRSLYLDDTKLGRQMARRVQGAKAAPMQVKWSEKTVTVRDFNVELDMSYEFVSQASLPIIETTIQRIALQRRLDEASEAIATLISGDGTSNAKEGGAATILTIGTTYGQSSHASVKDLLYATWLKFVLSFWPLTPTVVLAQTNDLVDWLMMAKPAVDPALFFTLLQKDALMPAPTIINVNWGRMSALQHPDCTANNVLALDKRYALWGYRRTGVDMVETDKLISSKFQKIVISNQVGFAKYFQSASKMLNCAG